MSFGVSGNGDNLHIWRKLDGFGSGKGNFDILGVGGDVVGMEESIALEVFVEFAVVSHVVAVG